MPEDFWFLYDCDIWRPTWRDGPWADGRQWHNWQVVARLAPGTSIDQAQAEIDLICAQLAQEYPESNENKGLLLTPVNSYLIEGWQTRIFLLMAALALVLLIACGNVAGLLLARGTTRLNEMAIRASVGASRGRLISLLMTESVVIAGAAGIAGIALALSLQGLMLRLMPLHELGITALSMDARVLLFALAISLLTGLIFGIIPAWRGTPVNLTDHLRSGLRAIGSGGTTRWRNALVVIQVALSVLLLVGAGLLIRSYTRLADVDPGFRFENLLTAELQLPEDAYPGPGERFQIFQRIMTEARALPGVESVGLINRLPLRDSGGDVPIWDADLPPVDASEWQTAYARLIMPGYFETMQVPLLAGRSFEQADLTSGLPVVIINQRLAENIFPDQNPVGKQLAVDIGQAVNFEIIGVVGNTRVSHISSNPYRAMYAPYTLMPDTNMKLAVRTTGSASAAVGPLREMLAGIDRSIPLAEPMTMETIIGDSMGTMRIITGLLAVFAVIALFLTATGLYGLLAYFVNSRRHEIGVRMALGAVAPQVITLVVKRGMILVAIGLLLGLAGAFGTNRLLSDMLYEVGVGDMATFVGVGGFLIVIALAACLLPSWRASRIDPVQALQVE
jgi:putative ABC transport system permease protein